MFQPEGTHPAFASIRKTLSCTQTYHTRFHWYISNTNFLGGKDYPRILTTNLAEPVFRSSVVRVRFIALLTSSSLCTFLNPTLSFRRMRFETSLSGVVLLFWESNLRDIFA